MPAEEVRTIQIKGGAAEDYARMKMGKRRQGGTTRKTRGTVQEGGDAPPGQPIPMGNANIRRIGNLAGASNPMRGGDGGSVANAAPTLPLTPKAAELTGLTTAGHAPPPVPVQTPAAAATAAATQQQTGGSKRKLVLAPPKKATRSKVLLAPPKAPGNPPSSRRHASTRKIRVQLSGLKKRLHRAKTIRKDSQEKSISEIRKTLEGAKLIKPATEGKKVPDSMLRDIYKDYLVLRNKAL